MFHPHIDICLHILVAHLIFFIYIYGSYVLQTVIVFSNVMPHHLNIINHITVTNTFLHGSICLQMTSMLVIIIFCVHAIVLEDVYNRTGFYLLSYYIGHCKQDGILREPADALAKFVFS